MATSSIMKNISIRNRYLCKAFLLGLENALKKQDVDLNYQRPYNDAKKEDIKKIFLNYN